MCVGLRHVRCASFSITSCGRPFLLIKTPTILFMPKTPARRAGLPSWHTDLRLLVFWAAFNHSRIISTCLQHTIFYFKILFAWFVKSLRVRHACDQMYKDIILSLKSTGFEKPLIPLLGCFLKSEQCVQFEVYTFWAGAVCRSDFGYGENWEVALAASDVRSMHVLGRKMRLLQPLEEQMGL